MGCVKLPWDPFQQLDPGPCIDVILMNSPDVIELGRAVGLEYPPPRHMKALLDTGASLTAVSKTYANHCKLFPTGDGADVVAVGAAHKCREYAGSISFPGADLQARNSLRIVSVVFVNEPHYAIIIGRDILRNWQITFDGRAKCVTIVE